MKPKLGGRVGCVGVSGSVRITARGCRSGGDLTEGQVSLYPRIWGVRQRMTDVNSVRRQGGLVCGQATCNQLSTANQLRTVDLRDSEI